MSTKVWFVAIISLMISFLFGGVAAARTETQDIAPKQKKEAVTIYINDKNGKEVASEKGFIADKKGVISTTSKIVSKWLEDVEHTITVRTEGGDTFPVEKLLSYSRKTNTARFKVLMPAKPISEPPPVPELKAPPAPLDQKAEKASPDINAKPPGEPLKTKKEPEKKLESAESLYLSGSAHESSQKYGDAIEAYKKTVTIKPTYVEAYVSLGLVYYKLGRYSEAVDAYNQAVKIRPDIRTVYNRLGTVYTVTGQYAMALEAFKKALALEPENAELHFNLGVAYFLNGNKDAALYEYLTLKKLDREKANSLLELIY